MINPQKGQGRKEVRKNKIMEIIIEQLKKIRQELWVIYHNAQMWQEQKEVAERLDFVVEKLKKDFNLQSK